jgi:hypothetical protein
VFLSYAWTDRNQVESIRDALDAVGLRLFIDDRAIDNFEPITGHIQKGLSESKVLLAFYSKVYPTRRACQWELTATYLAALQEGDPARRVLVINPEPTSNHIHPVELRDARHHPAPAVGDAVALTRLAESVVRRVDQLTSPLGTLGPLVRPQWRPVEATGSTRFVGRLSELWRIHSLLHADQATLTGDHVGPAVAQVRGLGGIGKSLLAEEYGLRFAAAYPGGVYWLRAYGSHLDYELSPTQPDARRYDQFRVLLTALGIPTQEIEPELLVSLLAQQIADQAQPCLWVVDDLPHGLNAQQVRA